MTGARVLIVEDHEVLAQLLADGLCSSGCEQVDVQDPDRLDREAVLDAVERHRPDVVLLDLQLGRKGKGMPLIAPITRLGSVVLVLTASDEPVVLGEALDEGAAAVLLKTLPFDSVAAAVRAAAAGRPLVAEAVRRELIATWRRWRDHERALHALFDLLTPSEAAVLEGLVDGASLEAIAASRGVAVGTVRSQVKSLLRKLQVDSKLAAVARAHEAGWPER